jgi:hypothetical protein
LLREVPAKQQTNNITAMLTIYDKLAYLFNKDILEKEEALKSNGRISFSRRVFNFNFPNLGITDSLGDDKEDRVSIASLAKTIGWLTSKINSHYTAGYYNGWKFINREYNKEYELILYQELTNSTIA